MKSQLHNSDEVLISAQQGWEQMQLLLDQKLPVKNNQRAGNFYYSLIVAASFLTIFLLSTLRLNNAEIANSFNKENVLAVAKKLATNTINIYDKTRVITFTKNATDEKIAGRSVIEKDLITATVSSPASYGLGYQKVTPPELVYEKDYLSIKTLPKEILFAKAPKTVIPAVATNFDSTGVPDKVSKQIQKHNWHLSAGLAMNATIGQQQNFTPYPAAVFRYNISNKIFLSTGFSAGSHVPGESRGVKKTVYVNDLVNNVQFYNTVNQFYDFSYADIPLLAGININKNIALQAGLQASVLLKSKIQTITESYDFQRMPAGGGLNGFGVGMAAPVNETDYRVEVKKMDYRFATGIKYNINKLALHLIYQHSLHPAIYGDIVSRNKHQLLTLNMQFNIK